MNILRICNGSAVSICVLDKRSNRVPSYVLIQRPSFLVGVLGPDGNCIANGCSTKLVITNH